MWCIIKRAKTPSKRTLNPPHRFLRGPQDAPRGLPVEHIFRYSSTSLFLVLQFLLLSPGKTTMIFGRCMLDISRCSVEYTVFCSSIVQRFLQQSISHCMLSHRWLTGRRHQAVRLFQFMKEQTCMKIQRESNGNHPWGQKQVKSKILAKRHPH